MEEGEGIRYKVAVFLILAVVVIVTSDTVSSGIVKPRKLMASRFVTVFLFASTATAVKIRALIFIETYANSTVIKALSSQVSLMPLSTL